MDVVLNAYIGKGDGINMSIYMNIPALAALIAGILILVRPRLLSYIVAIYLILIGIFGLTR